MGASPALVNWQYLWSNISRDSSIYVLQQKTNNNSVTLLRIDQQHVGAMWGPTDHVLIRCSRNAYQLRAVCIQVDWVTIR